MALTLRFYRRHLPHWEVEHARYFVTVRCADSLPREAVLRLREIADSVRATEPRSAAFAGLQREAFRTAEKYLDRGHGSCPLARHEVASVVRDELVALAEWQIDVPHFTIMPNHWHALLVPPSECPQSLSTIMKRLKGRTAKAIRHFEAGTGPVWQREWFDRWIRDDAEWLRCVAYVRNNPVKAGLAPTWQRHPWTQ